MVPTRLEVVRQLNLPKYERVIDIACGTGLQAVALAKSGHQVVGIDLSPAMVAQAKRKARSGYTISFVCADATKIPYADNFFDASILTYALHDMPEAIGLAVLAEMKRVTRKDGEIIIADYNVHSEHRAIAQLSHKVSKLFESKSYEEFLKRGVLYYLSRVGLSKYTVKTMHRGIVQIVTCTNVKADS